MTADSTVLIRAAGAVLWRIANGQLQVAVVHRPRYDDWTLPKGKLNDGEDLPAAAAREVWEETGFSATLGRRLGQVRYVVPPGSANQSGPKTVDYWSARATGGSFAASAEVDQLRWLTPDDAAALCSYSWDRAVLHEFTAAPTAAATVLLRHAKAGSRQDWDGDDDLRPLSARGRQQVGALRKFLPLFGPRRVYSAPLVRCVQTVQDLASDFGTTVVEESLLAEDGYWSNPTAAMERLLGIAEGAGPALLSSQGGVIPDLVRRLATEAGLHLGDEVPNKKGNTWVLSMHGRRLVAADYYPPPSVH